ncbi:PREDICTED: anthranilate N-benzoyltransferase protein 1 [Tarenaya hassleriana]|uniref:anthranilate N-benzoyltransferase protein 1 n=1 Tax=Tarenaya hassleriana TaxID=28532 RepID=UPI0008FD0E94|nr:PREDICTED: anthranilate N-benzoyltransferase protein 1 [Tarenaya hassleriana]
MTTHVESCIIIRPGLHSINPSRVHVLHIYMCACVCVRERERHKTSYLFCIFAFVWHSSCLVSELLPQAMEPKQQKMLEVRVTRELRVKASGDLPEFQTLFLSNLDLLSGRFPVTYFYLYPKQPVLSFGSIIESLRKSLSETLTYFYPFAGQIIHNKASQEPVIICNNNGALLVQAQAEYELQDIDFYNIDLVLQAKLVQVNPDFPLQVQVTGFTCGGVSVAFTFDHALGDASSFGKFLKSWSEISRKQPISCMPDHRRGLRPRSPPTYHPLLDKSFIKCTVEEIKSIPVSKKLIKRLYHVDVSSIKALQARACANGEIRTKIEAFSAYVWKKMVDCIEKSHTTCKMGWLIDGRGRLRAATTNYIGNVLSVAVGEASIQQLKEDSVSDIADIVHKAITEATNETHFADLIDWVECHRPGLMLSRVVLGQGGPALVLSSGRRFPVAELDFGFGAPLLGTVCSTVKNIGVCYLNQRPSAWSNGSWTISAIVWPELAAALESDTVFQPMSAKHLQLHT